MSGPMNGSGRGNSKCLRGIGFPMISAMGVSGRIDSNRFKLVENCREKANQSDTQVSQSFGSGLEDFSSP